MWRYQIQKATQAALLCAVLGSSAQAATDSPAVTLRFNKEHSGAATLATMPKFPLTQLWTRDLNVAQASVLVADGKVFVNESKPPRDQAQVEALDEKTGATVWGPVTIPDTDVDPQLAYDDGRVFLIAPKPSATGGTLAALNASTGQILWATSLPGPLEWDTPPAVANGMVYVGGYGDTGTVFGIDEQSGALVWSQPVNGSGGSSPAVSGNGVYVAYACQVYDLDSQTGVPLWNKSGICSGGGGFTPILHDGSVYVDNLTRQLQGMTFVLGGKTGVLEHRVQQTGMPAIGTDTAYFLSARGISAYPLNTLQPLWTYSPPPPQIGQTDYGTFQTDPVLLNDQVVISLTDSGYLYALDAATGAVLSKQFISGFWDGGQNEDDTVIVGDGLILLVGDGPLNAYR